MCESHHLLFPNSRIFEEEAKGCIQDVDYADDHHEIREADSSYYCPTGRWTYSMNTQRRKEVNLGPRARANTTQHL